MKTTSLFTLPATPAQTEIWMQQCLHPTLTYYNIACCYNIPTGTNVERLLTAINMVFAQEEALYARIHVDEENNPSLVFDPSNAVLCQVFDVSDQKDPNLTAEKWMREQVDIPFDMRGNTPLVRPVLIRKGKDDIVFFCIYSHIINDGWGTGLVFTKISQFYEALGNGEQPAAGDKSAPFSAFIRSANDELSEKEQERALAFWKPLLKQPIAQVLSTGNQDNRNLSCERVMTEISRELSNKLAEMAKPLGATLFHILSLAWGILFEKTYNTGNCTLNLPILNRSRDYKETVGFFVESRMLPLALDMNMPATGNLRAITLQMRELYRNYHISNHQLSAIYRESGNNGALRGCTSLSYVTRDFTARFDGRETTIRLIPHSSQANPFSLYLLDVYKDRGIHVELDYQNAVMDRSLANLFLARYIRVLELLADNLEQKPCDMDIIPDAERRLLRKLLLPDCSEFPPSKPVAETILKRMERWPDKIAVEEADGTQINYRDLVSKASSIARKLGELGIRSGDCVLLLLPHGANLVCAEIATMLTGAAFVPLALANPVARLRHICEDCASRCILTNSTYAEKAEAICSDTINVDKLTVTPEVFHSRTRPEDIAYIIYTSGSTGQPKGVEISNRALSDHMEGWERNTPQMELLKDGGQRKLLFSSPSFDVSMEDIYPALITGNTLVASPHPQWSAHEIAKQIVQRKITILSFPPAFLLEFLKFLEENPDHIAGHCIRIAHSGGETMHVQTALLWNAIFGTKARLFNVYGPTETTITSNGFCVPTDFVPRPGQSVPIGPIYKGRRARIVDEMDRDVPIGTEGELLIGGIGLADGYRNMPEETARRFILLEGIRYYRSGDIVRLMPDGNIVFMHRNDKQVKVLGNRIELGEIESCLLSCSHIRECAVIAPTDEVTNTVKLRAFVTLSKTGVTDTHKLREYIKQRLPEYMVPQITILEAMPKTNSGKNDRKTLATYATREAEQMPAPGAASNDRIHGAVQQYLATLWEKELGHKITSSETDFFEVGGDSIMATRLATAIGKAFRIEYPFALIFSSPTIRTTEQQLEKLVTGGKPVLEKMADIRIKLSKMNPEEVSRLLAAKRA